MLPHMSIDAASARYLQAKRFVLERIASGLLAPGARVPSENELVRTLEISRMTANRALRELAAEGVLVRIAGVGSFVAETRGQSHPLEVRNIADEIRARGHQHSTRVVALGTVEATPELAARFGLPPGARLDRSVLLHFEDGVPVQLEERHVDPEVVPGYLDSDFTRSTPHEILMHAAPLQRAEHRVRAVSPEGRVRRLLKLAAGEPALLIIRRTFARERVASVAHLFHPGSRFELAGAFSPDSDPARQRSAGAARP